MKKSIICIICIVLALFQSCRKKPDITEPVSPDEINMTLIYAVNHNNLNTFLSQNKRQMEIATTYLNPKTDKILIYSFSNGAASLQEMVYDNGTISYIDIKKYPSDVLSVDSERMKEVMNDAVGRYPQAQKSLFLWGHGQGPVNPSKYYRLPSQMVPTNGGMLQSEAPEKPELHAFGGEYASNTDMSMIYMDLDEMADAIPNSTFRTIWFDCCYMGSIEVAYQLRNKCEYLVAYPTEIMNAGLPYDRVIPYVSGRTQDLVKGAEELYNYYIAQNEAVTVAVMDMNRIWDFADAVRDYVQSLENKPGFDGVINYSRLSLGKPNRSVKHPYYDLISWLSNAEPLSAADKIKLDEVMKNYDKFVVKAYSNKFDFEHRPIDLSKFFGISVYDFNNENSDRDNYYKKLDWWKDVVKYSKWL